MQPVPCVLVVSIRWPCQLVILSVSIKRVGERVAFLVTALDQHRAAMLADQMQRGGDRVFLAGQAAQLGQVGRGDGRQLHQLAESGDGRLVGERRAAGGDHDRVEDDRDVSPFA